MDSAVALGEGPLRAMEAQQQPTEQAAAQRGVPPLQRPSPTPQPSSGPRSPQLPPLAVRLPSGSAPLDDDRENSPPAEPSVVLARAGSAAGFGVRPGSARQAPPMPPPPPPADGGFTPEEVVAAPAAAPALAGSAEIEEVGVTCVTRMSGGGGCDGEREGPAPTSERRGGNVAGGPSSTSLAQWSSGSFMAESFANWVIDFNELVRS